MIWSMFQLTAARRRLENPQALCGQNRWFQLTAARRRLAAGKLAHIKPTIVSTHSRPKAAGAYRAAYNAERMFQLTAARRRLGVTL